MHHNRASIAECICRAVRESPLVSLKVVIKDLRIGRHTAQRALRAHCQKSFRELQDAALIAWVGERTSEAPAPSLKELAAKVGYAHARSLTRRWKHVVGCPPKVSVKTGRATVARSLTRRSKR